MQGIAATAAAGVLVLGLSCGAEAGPSFNGFDAIRDVPAIPMSPAELGAVQGKALSVGPNFPVQLFFDTGDRALFYHTYGASTNAYYPGERYHWFSVNNGYYILFDSANTNGAWLWTNGVFTHYIFSNATVFDIWNGGYIDKYGQVFNSRYQLVNNVGPSWYFGMFGRTSH